MTVTVSVFLIAVGAVLHFATNLHPAGITIGTVALALMVAGLLVLAFGLFLEASQWRRYHDDYIRKGPRPPR